jgi:hypothetical protein
VSKARSLPIEWSLEGASLGYALVLPVNLRLSWKRLTVTNTLAYYTVIVFTAAKSFIVKGTSRLLRTLFVCFQ